MQAEQGSRTMMGETPCKVPVTTTYVEKSEASGHVGTKTSDNPMIDGMYGETPKQLTMRLRVAHAEATLLMTDDSVLSVALSCGFQSHEVFIRAFRRSFGMTPIAYRRRGFANRVATTQARQHAALVSQVGPCIALYHIDKRKEPEMSYAINNGSKPKVSSPPGRRGRHTPAILQIIPIPEIGRQTFSGLSPANQ